MIEEIRITNLGVIDETTLPLSKGFTALTGETGAGKTMVVTALGLLLGARADSGVIRAQCDAATVEGIWVLPEQSSALAVAAELGADFESVGETHRELILSRTLSAEGRNRVTIGGRSAPVAKLGELGEDLVTVHGQSEQLRLKSATQQRETLDLFAGAAHRLVLADYQSKFQLWQRLRSELVQLQDEAEERAAEAELLREALADFERLQPQQDEDEQLRLSAEKLENIEELRNAVGLAYEQFRSEEASEFDVLSRVNMAKRSLERASSIDSGLNSQYETLNELEVALTELSSDLAHYLSSNEHDAVGELEQIQQRRAELAQLARKYGGSLGEAINYAAGASDRLLELDQTGDQIAARDAESSALFAELQMLAQQLHEGRHRAAAQLSEQVSAELVALAMPNARVQIAVDSVDELDLNGASRVQFLLQPHLGAEARPIARGASGGELSRIMLAIEVVLAASDPVPTLVFDEIDAGVGGAAATEIGRRLATLAQHSQVIVVTHLAQVAAFADQHLRVAKSSIDGSTVSGITVLNGIERTAEIARLLSGHPDSENALAHAQELLESAKVG